MGGPGVQVPVVRIVERDVVKEVSVERVVKSEASRRPRRAQNHKHVHTAKGRAEVTALCGTVTFIVNPSYCVVLQPPL